jgi:hypothetical protein
MPFSPSTSGKAVAGQRLRQGCQKLSVTVSLRGEGAVNSTTRDSRSSGRRENAGVEEPADKKNGERKEGDGD